MDPDHASVLDGGVALNQQGWKAALDLFMPSKNSSTLKGSPEQVSWQSWYFLVYLFYKYRTLVHITISNVLLQIGSP